MPENTMEIWEAYIEAQSLMVEQYTEPFHVTYLSTNEDGEHTVTIEDDPRIDILAEIKDTFPGVTEEDIDLQEGYFHFSADQLERVDPSRLDEFVKYCDANYVEFVPRPCITGSVALRNDPVNQLIRERNIKVDEDGLAYCTWEVIQEIDYLVEHIKGFSRHTGIGAVFPIKQDNEYSLKKVLRETIRGKAVLEHPYREIMTLVNQPLIKEAQLHKIIPDHFACYYEHRIVVIVDPNNFSEFDNQRKQKNIFYAGEEVPDNGSTIIFPRPIGNEFHFSSDLLPTDMEPDPQFVKVWIRRSMAHYFPNGSFQLEARQYIIYTDSRKLLAYISEVFQGETFYLSRSKQLISFDFETKEELDDKLEKLRQFDGFGIHIYHSHRYKVRLHYESPLQAAVDVFQNIPSIQTTLQYAGTRLKLVAYIDERVDAILLRNRILNKLAQFPQDRFEASLSAIDNERLQYSINYQEDEYRQEIDKHLQYLVGEELIINGDEKRKVILTGAYYPKLTLTTEGTSPFLPGNAMTLEAPLRGAREKIKRLKDTVRAIFSPYFRITNQRMRHFLLAPSEVEAKLGRTISDSGYLEKQRVVKNNLLTDSGRINDGQIEAVAKSLAARDFFLIQGPPGTGKSTAIAEVIWQHIQNTTSSPYRILVTSETNLAVDNALDKLRNRYHTLIKPIRFGLEERLDKEGKRFSLERIKKWVDPNLIKGEEKEEQDAADDTNIVKEWMRQIATRAMQYSTAETVEVIKRWEQLLLEPDMPLRRLFANTYSENVNVVGATSGSIGRKNTEGNPTRFLREYFDTYYPDKEFSEIYRTEIQFDLIIQDEASKASPPELALPCMYGKKAIIIGDHRQLPPMIDSGEFLEQLEYLRLKSKDNRLRHKISRVIETIQRNRQIFDQSHFEFLFNGLPDYLKSTFNLQYRMHPAINETIKQFYLDEGGLECGLVTPIDLGVNDIDLDNFASRYHGIKIAGLIEADTHVLWLNVDSPEYKKGTSRVNVGEIEAIDWLINQISNADGYQSFVDFWGEHAIEEKQIGVITFYGAQAMALNSLEDKYPGVPLRISAVDKFQGMERNIVIISTVRSDCRADFPKQQPDYENYPSKGYPEQHSMGFAEFPNRLNVALSRAKRLLIVVGNARHFGSRSIYQNVLQTIEQHPNGRLLNFSDLIEAQP